MKVEEIIVRPYEARDKESVRRICCDTAFMGEDINYFFDSREVFANFAISYYTDYEPESLFVAEINDNVAGYIAGCRDTKRYLQIFQSRILPKAILNSLSKGLFLKAKTIKFVSNTLKSLLKGEFKRPVVFREYPAHLHININKEMRNLGVGLKLMEKFLGYLRSRNIPALHLTSISKIGQSFFLKMGFEVVYSTKVTYFDYLVKEPVYLICFGKRL